MQKYDIGIVGGGMVGRLAAKMLAPHFKVALIEASQPQPLEAIPSLRVSAINQFSCSLLKAHGILAKLDPKDLGQVLSIKTFEAESTLSFSASEIGALQLAYIIENERLNQAISSVCDEAGVTSIIDYCDQAMRKQDAGWILTLRCVAPIQVKLLIVAEGGMSPLRQALKIQTVTRDYGQNAWVAHVESSLPHRNTAYQRFLPSGPLAFLPLAHSHYSSIVWTLPTAERLYPEEICMRLKIAFSDLGNLSLLRGPVAFPLFAQTVKEYMGEGFVLIGDAAHTVHPLAGQGVNLGFHDVAALAAILIDAKAQQRDFSTRAALLPYQEKVQLHNRTLQFGFSSINQLFKSDFVPAKKMRSWAMGHINRAGLLKKILIKIAG